VLKAEGSVLKSEGSELKAEVSVLQFEGSVLKVEGLVLAAEGLVLKAVGLSLKAEGLVRKAEGSGCRCLTLPPEPGGYRSNQGKSGTLSLKFDPVAAPLPSQLEQRDRETEVDSIADESVWVPQPEGVEAVTGILTSNPPRSRPRTPRLEENLTLQLPGMASAPPPPPDA